MKPHTSSKRCLNQSNQYLKWYSYTKVPKYQCYYCGSSRAKYNNNIVYVDGHYWHQNCLSRRKDYLAYNSLKFHETALEVKRKKAVRKLLDNLEQ
jgi:hypothetical protein